MRQGYRLGESVLRNALVGVVDTVTVDGEDTQDTDATADPESRAGTEQADMHDIADTAGE